MFETDSFVLYGGNGVCRVLGKRRDRRCGTDREYYVLAPFGSTEASIFVPADNETLVAKMKKILSRDEIEKLIASLKDSAVEWEHDNRKRNDRFCEILADGDRREILTLIRSIYLKKKELASSGKHLAGSDENILKRAEKLINDEFAVALGIESNEVPLFIRNKIECN